MSIPMLHTLTISLQFDTPEFLVADSLKYHEYPEIQELDILLPNANPNKTENSLKHLQLCHFSEIDVRFRANIFNLLSWWDYDPANFYNFIPLSCIAETTCSFLLLFISKNQNSSIETICNYSRKQMDIGQLTSLTDLMFIEAVITRDLQWVGHSDKTLSMPLTLTEILGLPNAFCTVVFLSVKPSNRTAPFKVNTKYFKVSFVIYFPQYLIV
uniref:NR LBD domain-containing protein n=1 Tax=Heterorhabditis bacteriophora TaxID=37862 RepID=A0A1I7WQM7_HETBA